MINRGDRGSTVVKVLCHSGTAVAQWLGVVPQWDRGSTVVKVLCHKSEGRWFDPRWCQRIFHLHNPSDRTMALGSIQPLSRNDYQGYFLGVKAAGA